MAKSSFKVFLNPDDGANGAGQGDNTGDQTPTAPPENNADEISNSQLKSNPVFQKVTNELAQLRKEKAEREQAEFDAKAKAEADALAAKGDFEAALKLQEEKLKQLETKHKQELTERDLKLELANVGFKNKAFIKGVIADYNETDHGSVTDYIKAVATSDENKVFLTAANGGKPDPTKGLGLPVPDATNIEAATMTIEQARALQNNKDPKVRMKVLDWKAAYYDQHGKLPTL